MKIKSEKSLESDLSDVITKIRYFGGDRIKFIVLYGSAAKRKSTNLSDIDIAVFYSGDKRERFQFRVKILGRIGNKFDIQNYQDLPLYVQNEILSSGEVLYFSDYTEIFNTFMKTIREFEDFKPHLELYYSSMGV
ncbi:MAG: nucleotidyltransferase domain-containing protein [Candidatus Methanoperedenaceae archaeon]|nr:MAG: nucleotidyltransferase domain-containing protein [Candidatus Methanoperedenaceae archaeon]